MINHHYQFSQICWLNMVEFNKFPLGHNLWSIDIASYVKTQLGFKDVQRSSSMLKLDGCFLIVFDCSWIFPDLK